VRRRSEPYAEFARAAIAAGLPAAAALTSLASLAGRAAYSEAQLPDGMSKEASARVNEIKLAFKNVNLSEAAEGA